LLAGVARFALSSLLCGLAPGAVILITVAVLPAAAGLTGTAYLHPARFSAGFGTASLISAGLCLVGGALAAVTIRNPRPQEGPVLRQLLHCALDAGVKELIHSATIAVADQVSLSRLWHAVPCFPSISEVWPRPAAGSGSRMPKGSDG
jgi:hypothetical protein